MVPRMNLNMMLVIISAPVVGGHLPQCSDQRAPAAKVKSAIAPVLSDLPTQSLTLAGSYARHSQRPVAGDIASNNLLS